MRAAPRLVTALLAPRFDGCHHKVQEGGDNNRHEHKRDGAEHLAKNLKHTNTCYLIPHLGGYTLVTYLSA